ncbi:TPA: hypothetical protein ACG328_000414 [Escherichia coli]
MVIKKVGLGTAAKRAVGTGANQIPDMSAWVSGGNLQAGWRITPDGYIEQWGLTPLTTENTHVNFPVPFPNGIHALHEKDNTGDILTPPVRMSIWQFGNRSSTGFDVINMGSISREVSSTTIGSPVRAGCNWFARGK